MSNIIDAFLVTLGLDVTEFKKGAEEAKQHQEKVREEASKTAEYLKEKGHHAAEFFKELLLGAGSFLAMFTSLNKVVEYTEHVAEADRSTGRLAKALGITTEELSRYHGAVKLADGSAEGFNASMKSMGGMLVDIEKNLPRAKRALTVFQAAGIKGLQLGKKSDILDVIDQLSEKMNGMGSFEAMRLGQRMGLDSGTIRLFRQGKDTIEEWKKEMGDLAITTQEDVDAFEELEDAQKKVAQAKEGISRIIMRVVRPALIWFTQQVEHITVWVNKHGEVVRIAFIGIAAAMVVLGLAAAKAAIAVLAATWPLLLIAAAVGLVAAGVAWLYNEWKKWTEGGTSSLGKLFTAVTEFWNRIKPAVVQTIEFIKQIFMTYFEIIINQVKFFLALLSGDPEKIKEAWKELTESMVKFFRLAFNYILYQAALFVFTLVFSWKNAWAQMKADAAAVFDWLVNKWQSMNPAMKAALTAGGAVMGLPVAPMMTSLEAQRPYVSSVLSSSSTSTASTRTVSINEMHINTQATDAKGIATDIHASLSAPDLVGQADLGMGS